MKKTMVIKLLVLIGMVIFVASSAFFAFDVVDYYPVKNSYTDSLKTVIKANERTIWLLRNDSITHVKCFRIND